MPSMYLPYKYANLLFIFSMAESYNIFRCLQNHPEDPEFVRKDRNATELAAIAKEKSGMSTYVRQPYTRAVMMHNFKLVRLRLEAALYQRKAMRVEILYEKFEDDQLEKLEFHVDDRSVHVMPNQVNQTVANKNAESERETFEMMQLKTRENKRKTLRLEGYLRYVS